MIAPALIILSLAGIALWQLNVIAIVMVVIMSVAWLSLPPIFAAKNKLVLDEVKPEAEEPAHAQSLYDEANQHIQEQMILIEAESQQINELVQNAIYQLTESCQGLNSNTTQQTELLVD